MEKDKGLFSFRKHPVGDFPDGKKGRKRKRGRLRQSMGFLMAAVLIFNTLPASGLAVSASGQEKGLCEHHRSHTAECGYAEEKPCTHEHGEECYKTVTKCVHTHTDECYPEVEETEESTGEGDATTSDAGNRKPLLCTHVCSEESGCITKVLDCHHEHDESCGYQEAQACGYVCEICNGTEPENTENTEDAGTDTAECICETLCTEDSINGDCPVCGADDASLLDCKGKVSEENTENQEDTGICKHHQEHDADCGYIPKSEDGKGSPCTYECRICHVEDLIADLPDKVTEDNAEEVRAQLDEILALYRELTEDEQGQIDISRCLELQEALNETNAPMTLADGVTGNVELSTTKNIRFTADVCGENCGGHIITQNLTAISGPRIVVESGTHNITFHGLNIINTEVGVMSGATMNLTLEGSNTIKGTECGIYVPKGATLVITSENAGSLDVSGNYSAGIGGAFYDPNGDYGDIDCGTVIINGGNITATGGSRSAGIGGATGDNTNDGKGGNITINGGKVVANGGSDAPGIGGSTEASSDGLLTLSSANVLDSNTTLGSNNGTYYINSVPTADMISIPTDMHYTSADMAAEIAGKVTLSGGEEICGKTFQIDTKGWNLTVTKKSDLEYTASYTHTDKGTISKTVTILPCIHNNGAALTHHDRVEADCMNTGIMEYWDCSICGKNFSDKEGKTEITDIEIPTAAHTLTHHEKVDADCTQTGTLEYWECSVCKKIFSDKDGQMEITDINIPITAHTLTHHEGQEATCTAAGSREYWDCSVCGKKFSDQDGQTEIADDDIVIAAKPHTLTHHAEVEAGCFTEGNMEYWSCDVCGKLFADADGTKEVTDIKIPAIGHHDYGEWKSNKNGMHTRSCNQPGCDSTETENCSGGTATYTEKAKCTVCGGEYGELLKDAGAPTGEISIGTNKWNSFWNTITFGLFFKKTEQVTITAQDNESGVASVSYYISDSGLTEDEVKALDSWTAGNTDKTTFNINPDQSCVVYARITDNQGNVKYISSDGMVFDGTSPSITGVMDGETYCTSQTVTVTDDNLESVTVNGKEQALSDGKFTLDVKFDTTPIVIAATDKAGNVTTVTVNAGHNYGTDWKSDSNGHWHECAVCGEKSEVLAHTEDSGTVTKPATETEAGTRVYRCSACGYEMRTETIDPIPPTHTHSYGTEWKSDNSNHWHECSCGDKSDSAAHTEDSGTVTKPATETETGTRVYRCSVCGYEMRTEIIEKLPESHTHSYGTEWVSNSNNHWHECSCGEKSDSAAHTEDSGTVTKPATQTETGIRTYKCSVCGYEMRTEIIEKLPESHTHSYGTEWKFDSNNHWHECSCGEKSDSAAHTEDSGTVTKPATETETGIRTYKCSVCGYEMRTEIIEKLPESHKHSYGTEWKSDSNNHWHECDCGDKSDSAAHTEDSGSVTKPATETETGIRTYKCSVCGYKIRTEIIEKLPESHKHSYGTEWKSDNSNHWHECDCGEKNGTADHTWDSGTVTVQPTTDKEGEKTFTCTVCSRTKTETVGKLPQSHTHSYGAEWKSDNNNHWHECDCGEKNSIAAHTWDSGIITVQPTTDREGEKRFTCTVCGRTKTETVGKLPPSHKHSYGTEWKSDNNNHWHECSCGAKNSIAAHTWDSGTITVQPTTDREGEKRFTCTVCGRIKTETVGKLPPSHTHSYGTDWKSDSNSHWHECSCGAKNSIAAHTWDSGTITVQPTTDREGEKRFTCTVCGRTKTETVGKLPQSHTHSYGTNWKSDSNSHWHECTCGEKNSIAAHTWDSGTVTVQPTTDREGEKIFTCTVCGRTKTETVGKLPPSHTESSQPGDKKPDNNSNQPNNGNTEDTKVDTGIPFIKDEDGKNGWNVIRTEEEKAEEGSIINVDMNGSTVVPGDIFDSIKGKDITITFDMGNGIIWSVNGKSITTEKADDIDFSIKTGTNAIPVDIVNNITGERYSIQLSLSHEGEFGFTAILSINLGKDNAGLIANLYYYNESTGELEFICADTVAEDGMVSLAFTHASDYAVVIDADSMEQETGAGSTAEAPKTGEESTSADTTDTSVKNDLWNRIWVFVLCGVLVVAGLGIFFVGRKKNSKG